MDDWYYIHMYIYIYIIYIDINSLTIAKQWPRNGSYAGIWWNRLRLMIQKSYMLLGTGYSHWTHHFSDVGPKKCSLLNCVYKTLIRCFQTWAISSPVFSACSQIFQICRWLVTIIYIYIYDHHVFSMSKKVITEFSPRFTAECDTRCLNIAYLASPKFLRQVHWLHECRRRWPRGPQEEVECRVPWMPNGDVQKWISLISLFWCVDWYVFALFMMMLFDVICLLLVLLLF